MAISVITRERTSSGGSTLVAADPVSALTAAAATWCLKVTNVMRESSIATAADMNATLQP